MLYITARHGTAPTPSLSWFVIRWDPGALKKQQHLSGLLMGNLSSGRLDFGSSPLRIKISSFKFETHFSPFLYPLPWKMLCPDVIYRQRGAIQIQIMMKLVYFRCMCMYLNFSLTSPLPFFLGFKCPVCSKSVASNEMEVHFIMCLSKPRLSYNGKERL